MTRRSNQNQPIIKCSKEEMLDTLLQVYRLQGMTEEAAQVRAEKTVTSYFPVQS